MKLTLTLKDKARPEAAGLSRTLERGSLTIGRAAPADWVLEDPDRFLSRLHCRIEARGGDFVLTDTSTNGVLVNETAAPLGNGGSVVLKNGDRLQLGSFSIAVVIEDPASVVEDSSWLTAPQTPGGLAPEALPADWLKGSLADDLAPQHEFFQPPALAAKCVPEDWFLSPEPQMGAAVESLVMDAPEPPRLAPAPPPGPDWGLPVDGERDWQAFNETESALAKCLAHVVALREAVGKALDHLPPDHAAAVTSILNDTYQAAMARESRQHFMDVGE